jgi:peroxiredoxin
MNYILIFGLILLLAAIVAGFRFAWGLLEQHGRMLLRMEALEKQVEGKADSRQQTAEMDAAQTASAATSDRGERAERFGNRSLANSRLKRDGLKVGAVAPEFRLPRLEGGELALSDLRGRFVLLVFSSPHCGPCNALAPKLEKFHRKHRRIFPSPRPSPPGEAASAIEVVMISQGELEDNRAKVKDHGLTFPVVLQKQWEVSRDYAYFATPVAYLIDEAGIIGAEVAVGVDPIVELMARIEWMFRRNANGQTRAS